MSILIFAFIITCAKPPPPDEVLSALTTSADRSLPSSSTSEKKPYLAAGDVLVQCDLTTPFADESDESSAHGTLKIAVHRTLAPLASNAFLNMVKYHHFDHNYLFRAVKGFIVQWGIESPKPNGGDNHKTKFPKVDIDPPPTNGDSIRSNVRGALNFAGGNSVMGQVYVNRSKNSHLDREPGSLPFATLDEQSMSIIDSVYSYKEGLGQVKAVKKGDEEMKKLFPRISRIERCWIETDTE
mmetsp:Transcript_6117/g.13333  ORF Transcript_6117/g.13333 Transcript_6117/m.13333 type:complete len:240 (-) Transcript_6117:70-789(-)